MGYSLGMVEIEGSDICNFVGRHIIKIEKRKKKRQDSKLECMLESKIQRNKVQGYSPVSECDFCSVWSRLSFFVSSFTGASNAGSGLDQYDLLYVRVWCITFGV